MGVLERRQREKEAVRSQILAAATELFVTEGVPNVSMRKIADKIEYAPSTIYLYFKDKEQILDTICEEVFSELCEILTDISARKRPPLPSLREGLRAYIDFGLRHPHHYRLTFGHIPAGGVEGVLSPGDTAGLRCYDVLRQEVTRAMDAGAIRRHDIEVLSQSIWMMIHGVTDMLICSHEVKNFPWADLESVIETALDAILNGIRADRP